mmetsp:Transcript_46197/g.142454  ORF Transcript_46197/g.142454 Transcript_46197/m.142454 type:complete len:220 (-) Transcript_46197:259-918(-)
MRESTSLRLGLLGVSGAAAALAAAGLDVVVVEEVREEHEVRRVHAEAREVHHGVGARARGRALAVEDELDAQRDVEPEDHLHELQDGDGHGEGLHDGLERPAEAHPEVVRVHDGVHKVVHRGEPRPGGHAVAEREPREEQHGGVVPPVQEDDGPLADDEEDGVDQLGDLREREDDDPETHRPRQVRLFPVGAEQVALAASRQLTQEERNHREAAVDRER